MFKRRHEGTDFNIMFNGQSIACKSGETVAAVVLTNGPDFTRKTPKNAQPRAPFCMMGVCFECLMEIDGVANQQACLTIVKPGMKVEKQLIILASDWA